MADQIETGSFVAFGEHKGRVDLIVRSGKVPGVVVNVEGTTEFPAARVVVWKDGKPTDERYVAALGSLTRIAALDDDGEEKSDPAAYLVALQAKHQEWLDDHDGGEDARLSGYAIKTAYDRGLAQWPGPDVTDLEPIDWALGRAEHLVKVARGEADVCNDFDLLNEMHPLATHAAIERAEVEEFLTALHEDVSAQ